MKNKLITFITLSYNCKNDLIKTVDSVLGQKCRNYEYIVIDGGSTDGTVEYLKKTKGIKWISEKDDGISDAFNKGIRLSHGEYVCFLNSADTLINNSIVEYIEENIKKYNEDIIFFQAIMEDGNLMPSIEFGDDVEKIWLSSRIPHQATFVKKSVFDKVGMFNKFIKIRMDYDFFVRCKNDKCTYRYIKTPIVNYDLGGVSSNLKNRYLFKKEALSIKLLYGEKITFKEILSIFKTKILKK